MGSIPIKTTIILFILLGVIYLQVFLSKKENKILGLILPVVAFLHSTIIILWLITGGVMVGGFYIFSTISSIFVLMVTNLLLNIPTIIFLLIYFSCRKTINRSAEIRKTEM